ncbi:hypothetical protein BGW80DRAFT_1270750 [Lactifluus volemus]|nr:hypothetical protein BGW80DRAFT_1270750 [Lactifluus volemus]
MLSCLRLVCSNIYTRRAVPVEFQVVCPWLLLELVDPKLWNDDMMNRIVANNGSIQAIPEIPADVKAISAKAKASTYICRRRQLVSLRIRISTVGNVVLRPTCTTSAPAQLRRRLTLLLTTRWLRKLSRKRSSSYSSNRKSK